MSCLCSRHSLSILPLPLSRITFLYYYTFFLRDYRSEEQENAVVVVVGDRVICIICTVQMTAESFLKLNDIASPWP